MNYRRLLKKGCANALGIKQKQVIAIPEQARLGNLLYFFLHCYIMRNKGVNLFVLHTSTMDYWLGFFPKLSEFVVYQEQATKYDNVDWMTSFYQNFGKDFTQEDLTSFIGDFVIKDLPANCPNLDATIINIRRGDFYNEANIKAYGFDQVEYIDKVKKKASWAFDSKVAFISDDLEWCKENFKSLVDPENIVIDFNRSPINDFLAICNSSILIITNSTFSYWGAYIAKVLNPKCIVFAPNFGSSHYENSIAIQLDASWQIIDVINA